LEENGGYLRKYGINKKRNNPLNKEHYPPKKQTTALFQQSIRYDYLAVYPSGLHIEGEQNNQTLRNCGIEFVLATLKELQLAAMNVLPSFLQPVVLL
jgi:hypothetical protein